MKILNLGMIAYGPFTDREIEFDRGSYGLHVVFGANEAGKSSALRALRSLLYGIPAQTVDAFVHPYESLRLSGRLRSSDGRELAFIRRKGSKNTLLSVEEKVLDERELAPYLNGVSEDQFKKLWGIDHSMLLEGGREILAGQGDVGASLFAASSGISAMNALRKALEDEAQQLFLARGHKRAIHKSINSLRSLRKEQRDLVLTADEWGRGERALIDSETSHNALIERFRTLGVEKARVERLTRTIPLLAQRAEAARRLEGLSDAVSLSEDFAQRRRDCEGALRSAEKQLDRSRDQITHLEQVLSILGPQQVLAKESGIAEEILQRFGSITKAERDRAGLIREAQEQKSIAAAGMHSIRPDLGPDDIEGLRAIVSRRSKIEKLSSERERLEERLETALERLNQEEDLVRLLSTEVMALPQHRDLAGLVSAIEEAESRGNVEDDLKRASLAITRIFNRQVDILGRMRLKNDSHTELAKFKAPTMSAVARFERKLHDLEDQRRENKATSRGLEKSLRALDTRIQKLQAKKPVPTEIEMLAARKIRDAAFQSIRRGLNPKARTAAAIANAAEHAEKYPAMVKKADDLSDGLRSEADRVAEYGSLTAERQDLTIELQAATKDAVALASALDSLESEWSRLWKGFGKSSPSIDDGRGWLENFVHFSDTTVELNEHRRAHAELSRWTADQSRLLHASVTSLESSSVQPETLLKTLNAARRIRQRIEQENISRKDYDLRIAAADQRMRAASELRVETLHEIERWNLKWHEAFVGYGEGTDTAYDDALDTLNTAAQILQAIEGAESFNKRVAGIDRDAETFVTDVRDFARRLGEGCESGQEAEWVDELRGRLRATIKAEGERTHATLNLTRLQTAIADDQNDVAAALETFSSLCAEAQCTDHARLAEIEIRSTERRTAKQDTERLDKVLLFDGPLEELAADVLNQDRDLLEVRLGEIALELAASHELIKASHEQRAAAHLAVSQLANPTRASEKSEEIQCALTSLKDEVRRYSQLRIASTLLARRIDEYRQSNQAPLLNRAGELFQRMTLGRFERLDTDSQDDRSVLVGIRSNGKRALTEAMSEGTVDQLFLSLRLAAVEASCAAGEGMPFIVDDILIQFDDDRSAATIEVLGEVAEHTQVVLFTHHRRDAEVAGRLSANAQIFISKL